MVVLRYIQEVSNTYCICLAAAAKSTDVDHPTLITQKGDLIMEARKVELLEKRPGYDTTWKISTEMGIFRIHRDEDETLEHLTTLVAQSQNPQEVIALDQHGKIYYD